MQLKGTVTKKKVVATSRPVESSIRTTPPSTGKKVVARPKPVENSSRTTPPSTGQGGPTAEQKLALVKDRKDRKSVV